MGKTPDRQQVELSDETLMANYQAGDLSAFNLLYLRYETRAYNYLLRLTGNPDVAADLFQETFLRLHRHREQYDPARRFSTYLFTIASNLAKTEFARRSQSDQSSMDIEQLSGTESADADVEQKEIQCLIQRALDALPSDQRQVILLNRFEHLNYREIADLMGKSASAVKQMAYRALQGLRQHLKDI